jgi:hypothetical protein
VRARNAPRGVGSGVTVLSLSHDDAVALIRPSAVPNLGSILIERGERGWWFLMARSS